MISFRPRPWPSCGACARVWRECVAGERGGVFRGVFLGCRQACQRAPQGCECTVRDGVGDDRAAYNCINKAVRIRHWAPFFVP
mgnify:CR=1 FL=1